MSTQPDDTYDACAWGSHLPALLACVGASHGPVLELGVGHFSTPALHCLVLAMDRSLVSVEDDKKWFREFAEYGRHSNRHTLIHGKYDDVFHQNPYIIGTHRWGTVFIDNSPGGERRMHDFMWFADCSDFVVVHDYEKENEEAIAPLLKGMEWHVTRRYLPPTLVASHSRKLPRCVRIY